MRNLHGAAADVVDDFLRALADAPARPKAPDDLGTIDIEQEEFGLYEDVDLTDPKALQAEVELFNASVREFKTNVALLNAAVESYNDAVFALEQEREAVEESRVGIASHAGQLIRVINGAGDPDCVLPFVEEA